MGPIGSFNQYIGQDCGYEFARRILIEKRDCVDRFQAERQGGAVALRNERARRSFETRDARIRIERQDQDVAERAGALEQAYVPGMEQVVAAVREDDGFAGAAPFASRRNQFGAGIETGQEDSIQDRLPPAAALR